MNKITSRTSSKLLNFLNTEYLRLHSAYENQFWVSYMGTGRKSSEKDIAKWRAERDVFRTDKNLKLEVETHLIKAKGKTKDSLLQWKRFFDLFQVQESAIMLRKEASKIDDEILKLRSKRKEGYIDPVSKSFVKASENKMAALMRTSQDEVLRRACFDALNELPLITLDLYIQVVNKRNEFARAIGYEDFYAYKLWIDEKMEKSELFGLFDGIYSKTKYGFKNLRSLEKSMPGLRKPWNFGYMMSGSFTKEEDPYFTFDQALMYWGKSFSALGIDMAGGSITLDLLDRKGKHNNGFCHWPIPVHYMNGKRIPGHANFTCNVIPGVEGSGVNGLHTLFHEGGHAAHYLNSTESEICNNTEYPPSTVSWAETQSMFIDTICSSIEWKMKYAKTKDGTPYPFDLFERRVKKLEPLRPLDLMHMMAVARFEKEIYETKKLTREKVISLAQRVHKNHYDRSENTLSLLNVPHIYDWESSAYYHGYALAELGLAQWREYFFKKYGYIVDNPHVGKEMKRVWRLAARHPSKTFIKMATGKPLSAKAYLNDATMTSVKLIKRAKDRIAKLNSVKVKVLPIDLRAKIELVHGKKKIADNSKGFEIMSRTYAEWVHKQAKK
ncbi:MAG: M3 family metallopeptidase [Patescibacteria group bacterium]